MRQQLLLLYLAAADLESGVVGWSRYDGAASATDAASTSHGDESEPPYRSVVDAMRDGWRVIQFPALPEPTGDPYRASHLRYEYVLEKLVDAP